jgi:hypothetical protein
VTGGMFTATAFFISGFLELELSVSTYFRNPNKIYLTTPLVSRALK